MGYEKQVSEMQLRPSARYRVIACQGISGFTLVELIVTVAILAVLVLMAIPSYTYITEKAKVARCISEVRTLDKDVTAFTIDKGYLPDSLNDIGRGGINDPWGNPYNYADLSSGGATPYEDFIGDPLNTDFDLYSNGPDGLSTQSLTAGNPTCDDDILRGADGNFVGIGIEF